MTSEQTTLVLSRLEMGFRMNSTQLKTMEQDLERMLPEIRSFGSGHSPNDSWLTDWNEAWDNLAGVICHLRDFVSQMDTFIQSHSDDRLQRTLNSWTILQKEDQKLEKALQTIRRLAVGFPSALRPQWNQLAKPVEAHLETIHTCAQALRIKLELLKQHSSTEVEHLLESLFSKLPVRSSDDDLHSEEYSRKYRQAVIEIEKEQHETLGIADILKSLLMWIDSPEERMNKDLSLQMAVSGTSPGNS